MKHVGPYSAMFTTLSDLFYSTTCGVRKPVDRPTTQVSVAGLVVPGPIGISDHKLRDAPRVSDSPPITETLPPCGVETWNHVRCIRGSPELGCWCRFSVPSSISSSPAAHLCLRLPHHYNLAHAQGTSSVLDIAQWRPYNFNYARRMVRGPVSVSHILITISVAHNSSTRRSPSVLVALARKASTAHACSMLGKRGKSKYCLLFFPYLPIPMINSPSRALTIGIAVIYENKHV